MTVAAFLLVGLLAAAACETTRVWFLRLLADQPATARTAPLTNPGERS